MNEYRKYQIQMTLMMSVIIIVTYALFVCAFGK